MGISKPVQFLLGTDAPKKTNADSFHAASTQSALEQQLPE